MIFNEDKLQAEIIKTWGEFGVHNEVFQAMRKKISDKKQLTLTDVVSSASKCYTCDNCGRVRNNAGCIVCGSE
jgi:recombinational DNA repair protein RecR